jgi:excisionase family DNA binding protein
MTDRVETPKQLAARVNVSERQIRNLIRNGELDHVMIGCRIYIPADAWPLCIERKRKSKWRDETKGPSFDILKIVEPTTSPGHLAGAAASAQLARQTAKKLRSPSPNGCTVEASESVLVIPLRCS